MKKWIVRRQNSEYAENFIRESDISPLCSDVLAARGFRNNEDAVRRFFAEELFDPFLLKDMYKAVEVINDAVENGKRICIYGDYDCDGITSTVILYSYLECMGADVFYRLPERSEGYGLNPDVVKEIADKGTNLIITVDNGISALDEAELIYELGMKLVVTDHHQPGDSLPKAEAVIDPYRQDCPSVFKNLCGAGVVLKLIAALEGGDYETALSEYAEIAAIGTVADIVELGGENRYIVRRGLEYMQRSDRCGMNALIDKSGIKKPVTSTSIAFGIAPRINAAGRFGSPSVAARLLLTEDEQEAALLADDLDKLNESRKKTENDIMDEISRLINENPEIANKRVLVLSGNDWHHGVIGIVAARIMEKFDKPCFIITVEGEEARGSARAFGDFSVYKALYHCSDILTKFGGHKGAGGFSLKASDIESFEKLLQQNVSEKFDTMPVPELIADKIVRPNEITIENIEDLKILEPFGEGNPQPVFAIAAAEIIQLVPLSNGLHTKIKVKYGVNYLDLLLFRISPDELMLSIGDKADFMVTLETQIYNGQKQISIIVKDFRKSGMEQTKYFAAKDVYEKVKRNESLPDAYYHKICPDRTELVPLYLTIAGGKHSIDTLYMKAVSDNMNYCKLGICVDIFEELGLVNVNRFSREVTVVKNALKTSIDNSEILQNLRSKL